MRPESSVVISGGDYNREVVEKVCCSAGMRPLRTAVRFSFGLYRSHLVLELVSNQPGVARPEQLEKIVSDADELPFAAHLFLPLQQKQAEASRLFELAEHRLR